MSPQFDVIIVGAGPSGASCAYNLKRFYPAASVLLIDKANFPRDKPCGGGVSPDVHNYLDFDLDSVIDFSCNKVELITPNCTTDVQTEQIYMVRREIFDNYLMGQVKAKGVETQLGCEVLDIEQHKKYSIVKTQAGDFQARLVVIAEGGAGKLTKRLGISVKNGIFAALEYEHYTNQLDGKLRIYFDQVEQGYAWDFPKSDGLSMGICALVKGEKKIQLPQLLKRFLTEYNILAIDKKNLKGHPIQVYRGRQNLVYHSWLLIGEISGCVDPLTAEGIRPAIKSGYLAAQVLSDVLRTNKLNRLKRYNALFHREIGKDFQFARLVLYLIHRYRNTMLLVLSSPYALKSFMSVFSGESTYRGHFSMRRIFKLVKKEFLNKIFKDKSHLKYDN